MTLLQRRAWNVLLANAYNQLPDKDIHSVSVVELAAKLGFNSKNEDYLKEILETLVDCKVKWNLLGKDKKQEWGVASLLAEVRIHDGICFYQYSHTLRQKLHNPRVYAKLNLRLQNQFTQQVCPSFYGRSVLITLIPTETKAKRLLSHSKPFGSWMGIEVDEYQTFKALNQRVIKPAIKEINDLTNYLVEVEQKRLGPPDR